MTKRKVATKPKSIGPRDAIITEQQKKIEALIDRLVQIEQREKAACSAPRPYFSPGIVVSEPALIVDNNGRSWWINPATLEIRAT